MNYKIIIGPFTTEGLVKKIRLILMNVYDDMLCSLTKNEGNNVIYTNDYDNIKYRLDTKYSINSLITNPSKYIAVLNNIIIKSQRGNIHLATTCLDINKLLK